MELSNMYNFATSNKWIAVLPFHKIEPGLTTEQVTFNLIDFTIPEITMGGADLSTQGIKYTTPGNIIDMQKEVNFNYILSSNWYQYILLYKWMIKLLNRTRTGEQLMPWNADSDIFINTSLSVYPLSEFLKPILEFRFDGIWLKRFGTLALTYGDDAPVVKHSFTCSFIQWGIYDPESGVEMSDIPFMPTNNTITP